MNDIKLDKAYKSKSYDSQVVSFMLTDVKTSSPSVVYMAKNGDMLSSTVKTFHGKYELL